MTVASRGKMRWARRRALFALFAQLGALAVTGDAQAFCRSTTCRVTAKQPSCPTDEDECPSEGAKLFWPTSCIGYATNKLGSNRFDPEDTRAVIRKAFEAWSEVECPDGHVASMTFQEREPVACRKSQYNPKAPNVNVILFQDSMWRYRDVSQTLAKTSVTYNDETGEIYDADIEINTANEPISISNEPGEVKADLQAILTHEVGHFIGLAHSHKRDAVMYAEYSNGSTAQRRLTADDVEAICAVYPPDNGVVCDTEPRNGFSGRCDDAETGGICSVQPGGAGGSYSALAAFGGIGLLLLGVRRIKKS